MAFIYIPIVIMIIFSFNAGTTVSTWRGWSLRWYEDFFKNSPFIKSIITSLFVAFVSTIISLLIGVAAAIGLSRCRRNTQRKWMGIANIPLINADVVTAVSLMMVFLVANLRFGIFTLIMAHISFNVPYVLITVMPRLRKVDHSLLEAGEDLGANNWQLLIRVILPVLKPAIIAAAAIAFAMSFDDFIISYFTGGSQTNVSTYIYTMKKIRPYVFAFGTMLVAIIILGILTWNAFALYKQSQETKVEKLRNKTYKSKRMAELKKELLLLEAQKNGNYKTTYSTNIFLWLKYECLKFRIKMVSAKTYDKKITRLEWKRYKLRSQINKEKRYYDRQELATKRLAKLNAQLDKTNDVHKAAKLTLQKEKVEERLTFLNEEIEALENREDAALHKAEKVEQEISALKWNLATEELSKKESLALNRKIKRLEIEKIEILEGKNMHKLRLVVERLRELQDKNYNVIFGLTDQKNHLEKQIFINKPLTKKTSRKLTSDIQKIDHKINLLAAKVKKETLKLVPNYEASSEGHAKSWLARSWKMLGALLIGLAAFSGLTVAYVLNNTYNLVIGNWGEYIDPALIGEFEREYKVRVNYQEYDSNETLYNKLYTFNYDLMVPSDYMVKKLALEDRLELLNYNLLNIDAPWAKRVEAKTNGANLFDNDKQEKVTLDDNLVKLLANYEIDGNDGKKNLLDYSVPYLWGDLVIVVNPTQANLDFLKTKAGFTDEEIATAINTGELNQTKLSWDILKQAAQAGKRVALNNDPKNIFAIAGQVLFQKPNLETDHEIEQANQYLANDFINKPKVSLNNDELVDNVGQGRFDFAMMYNGDAVEANRIYNGEDVDNGGGDDDGDFANAIALDEPTKFLFGRPNIKMANGRYQTTNVFSDNLVMSKTSHHKDLAYKFINFLISKATDISEYVGITSPVASAMDELTQPGNIFSNYKRLYYPCVDALGDPIYQQNKDKDGKEELMAFKYLPRLDEKLVDYYNELVAGKIG